MSLKTHLWLSVECAKSSTTVGLYVSNSNMHRFYISTYPSILYTKQCYLLVRIILYINYGKFSQMTSDDRPSFQNVFNLCIVTNYSH